MKQKFLILFSLLLFSSSLAQMEVIPPVVDDGKGEIFQFVKELNFAFKYQDTLLLTRCLGNKSDISKENFTQQKPVIHSSRIICTDINLRIEDIHELNSDEATVICLVLLNGVKDFSNSNYSIKLKKKDGQWIIPDISENFEIEINKDLVLDYLAVVRNIRTARTRTLNLLGAVHSQQGDLKNLLTSIDQNYAEILPGESIDFNFQFVNLPTERIAYIIKTVGRYETDSTAAFNKLAGTGDEELIPIENKLFDNYPNPFNPTTQIKYSVKENEIVSLRIYDILGNEISSLVNEEKQPGIYTVTFDAGSLSSGIYFYSIKTNNFYQTKKMLLIK